MTFPLAALWLGLSSVAAAAASDDVKAGADTVKLPATMRPQPRDRAWFAALPCAQLQSVRAGDERETREWERRRQQCVDRYKAFYPGGGAR